MSHDRRKGVVVRHGRLAIKSRKSQSNLPQKELPVQIMEQMKPKEFQDDEAGYMDWLSSNPRGFVLSTERENNLRELALPRANCRWIRRYNKNMASDAFTGQKHIKVCSHSVSDLRDWIKRERQGTDFTRRCSKCNPDP